MSIEAKWYSSYEGQKPPRVGRLSKDDLTNKTIPYRLALGRAVGMAGYRSVQNLDGTTTWWWPRRNGDWWAVPQEIITKADAAYQYAVASAPADDTGKIDQIGIIRLLAAQISELGGITMITDTRISEEYTETLPAKIQARITAALQRRNTCPEIDVYTNDWLITELCQPIKVPEAVTVMLRGVPEPLRRAVKAKAAAEGKSMQAAVIDLMRRWVEGEK